MFFIPVLRKFLVKKTNKIDDISINFHTYCYSRCEVFNATRIKVPKQWITICMEIYRDIIDFIGFFNQEFPQYGYKKHYKSVFTENISYVSLFTTTWNPFPPGDKMIHNSDNDNIWEISRIHFQKNWGSENWTLSIVGYRLSSLVEYY